MTPRTIRSLDYWCGVPACLLLTAWTYVRRVFSRPATEGGSPRKILFLKLTEQGAIVLAFPAARRAADRVGSENVFFCVFEEHRPMPALLGVVPPENVFGVRQANILVFLADLVRLFVTARREGIDAVIDLEFFSRASAVIACLTGARSRVGYHRFSSEYPYRGDLMTHRVQYNPYTHTAAAYLMLVESLFRPRAETPLPKIPADALPLPRPSFAPTPGQREHVLAALAQEAGTVPEEPYFLINPNAGDMLPLRKWPASQFEGLIRRLLVAYQHGTVILTGSPSERPAMERMQQAIASPRVVNLAGRTHLHDLITLYTMADVLVTNDSGPGHFASLADLPCVVLFGPETPRLFAPLGEHVHVVYAALACSPCVNVFNQRFSPCRDNVCMRTITVDEVFDAVQRALQGREGD